MVVVVSVGLGDDSVEVSVSTDILRKDRKVIFILTSMFFIHCAAVGFKAEDGLDARLDGSLLELEVRRDAAMLGQRHGRIAQLGRTGDMLSRSSESISETKSRMMMQVNEFQDRKSVV